jgi:hypothetical protein
MSFFFSASGHCGVGPKGVAIAGVTGKADNAGQENDSRGGNNGDNDEDDDKWGRGAQFNSSSSLLSSFVGLFVSNAIAAASLLLSGIAVPRMAEKKKDIERVYKKMTAKEKNDLMRKLAELDAEDANDDESVPPSPTPV